MKEVPRERTSSILVVDDEKGMRELLEIMLSQQGYRVTLAGSGRQACEMLEKTPFDLVVTDIRMEDLDGIGVLRKAKALHPETVVVLISAFATADTAVEAMKEGAYDFIPKPFQIKDLQSIVQEALESRKAAPAGAETRREKSRHFGCLVGESPQMRRIYDLIRRVAGTRSNILILGESGTGKELVAKAIHQESPRRDRRFVTINCAGIPENLIESELFGYRKGAFTGAATDREGLFSAADGGTVFLDEVGELSPAIQVKLLRVIQERTFTAVGGTEEKSVDVRFIAATNKDLEKAVIDNSFREDLYFRLNVITLGIPPLREREGDLPLLAQHFLEKYCLDLGKDIRKISAYAMDILKQYPFPGNVRELENIVERSVTLETSNIVLPESLTLSNFRRAADRYNRRRLDLTPEGVELDKVLEALERDYVLKALEMARGSKPKAAELLGISLRSLRYRLDKLGAQSDGGEPEDDS